MTRGGVAFTNFTYSNGVITIAGAQVTGNFVISGTATRAQYAVTNSITAGSTTLSNTGSIAAMHGTQWEGTLTAQSGWHLPPASGIGTVTVTVGGTVLPTSQFTYTRTNNTTGKISIPAGSVTGDIVVRGASTPTLGVPIANVPELIAEDSFRARWSKVAGATEYLIDVSTSSSFATFVPEFNGRNVGNTTHVDVKNLNPDVTYYYRVRAVSAANVSASSNVRDVRTLVLPSIFVNPARIQATSAPTIFPINISSNRYWTITSNVKWARLYVSSGSAGDSVVSLHIDENKLSAPRNNGVITIRMGSIITNIPITQAGFSTRNVSVAFYYHPTYQDAYGGNYASQASSMLSDANLAFRNIHGVNLTFQQGIDIGRTLPMDECLHRYDMRCTVLCGTHENHHKNIAGNMGSFTREIFNQSHSRLGVLAYRANLCSSGSHNGSPRGAAQAIVSRTSIVDFIPGGGARQRINNVRVLQHEIAHNFGVYDGYSGASFFSPCTSGSKNCIMDGGGIMYDNRFGSTDTFCDAHTRQFDRYLH